MSFREYKSGMCQFPEFYMEIENLDRKKFYLSGEIYI